MLGAGRFGGLSKPFALTIAALILFTAGWLIVTRLSANFSDHYESFYPSLVEADKDGAITRGWIPDDLLPSSSHSIHELHNLSPSREWCGFEFASHDSEKLRKNVKRIDVLPPSVRAVRDPDVSWWPSVLKGDLDVARIRGSGFDLYQAELPASSAVTDVLLFAIDWSNGRGFFYRTSKPNS
jgi:hypothetical protein